MADSRRFLGAALVDTAKQLLTDRGGGDAHHTAPLHDATPHIVVAARRAATPRTVVVLVAKVTRNTLVGAHESVVPASDSPLFGARCGDPCECASCAAPTVILMCKEKVSPTAATIASAEARFHVRLHFMSACTKDRYMHCNAVSQLAITQFKMIMPARFIIARPPHIHLYRKLIGEVWRRPCVLPRLLPNDPIVRHFGLCAGTVVGFVYPAGAELAGPKNPCAGMSLTPIRWRVVVGDDPIEDQ
ncbi:MAG TPA: hypothetical protein EYP98_01140 [Planctomycetes bacterium]|nr:hypothetical protein [Planctomycetota bacterium]